MSWLFVSGGQSIGTSVSVLPMNIQDWFPLGLTNLISLQSKRLSRLFSNTTNQSKSLNSLAFKPSLWSNSYICTWLPERNIVLTIQTFVGTVMSLLFNMLSRLVIAFLPRNKRLLISWLQSPSTVIFGAQGNKVSHWLHLFPHLFAMKWWNWKPWLWLSVNNALIFVHQL